MGNAVIILPSKWMDKNQPPLNFLLSSFGQLNLNSNGKNKKESFEENEPVFVSNSNLNGFFKIAQKGETIWFFYRPKKAFKKIEIELFHLYLRYHFFLLYFLSVFFYNNFVNDDKKQHFLQSLSYSRLFEEPDKRNKNFHYLEWLKLCRTLLLMTFFLTKITLQEH